MAEIGVIAQASAEAIMDQERFDQLYVYRGDGRSCPVCGVVQSFICFRHGYANEHVPIATTRRDCFAALGGVPVLLSTLNANSLGPHVGILHLHGPLMGRVRLLKVDW